MRTNLFIIFTLTFCALGAKSQCPLDRNYVTSHNQVFFTNNQLLRVTSVDDGTNLQLACNGNAVEERLCQSGAFTNALPDDNCATRLSAVLQGGNDPNCVAPAESYAVGYVINGVFSTLYRSCYNKGNVQALYVEHEVYNNPYATNRPEQKFTTDRVITGADAESFSPKSVYDRFNELLGPSQGYVRNGVEIVINRGHLAPSADFLFVENKRATFKYINVMPQFASINNGNWRTIEEWIQSQSNSPISVTTGAAGVLSLPHADIPDEMVPMYLGDSFKNPIPMWTYKIVQGTVFVTYNNPFATDVPSSLLCNAVNCPAIGLRDDFRVGYTYCCDLNNFNNIMNG